MGFSDGPTGTSEARCRRSSSAQVAGWKGTRKAALGQHLLARVPLGASGYVFLELALKNEQGISWHRSQKGPRGRLSSETTGPTETRIP